MSTKLYSFAAFCFFAWLALPNMLLAFNVTGAYEGNGCWQQLWYQTAFGISFVQLSTLTRMFEQIPWLFFGLVAVIVPGIILIVVIMRVNRRLLKARKELLHMLNDRRKTQELLHQSESNLKALVSSLDDVVAELDPDLRFVNVWTGDESRLIFPVAETIGKRLDELFDETVSTTITSGIEKHVETGRQAVVEYQLSVNKNRYWFQARISSYKVSGSDLKHLVILTRNITKIKTAELALNDNQQKLKALFELNPLGIVLTTTGGKYIEVNPTFLSIVGYTWEELQEKTFTSITPPEYYSEQQKHISILLEKGYYGPFEKEYIRKDGSRVPVLLNGQRITDSSGETLIWTVISDITARKSAENLLVYQSHLLHGAAQASLRLLASSDFDSAITNALEIMGHYMRIDRITLFEKHEAGHGEELVSQKYEWVRNGTIPLLYNPAFQNIPITVMPRWRRLFSQQELIYGFVKDFPTQEQQILRPRNAISVVAAPVFVEEQLWGFIGFDDCTQGIHWNNGDISILEIFASSIGSALLRRKKEEELQMARRMAESANVAKTEFLANISHEIRTPINVVLGFAELLEARIHDTAALKFVRNIKTGGKGLLTLINDLLDMSKIEAGRLEIQKEPMVISHLMSEIMELFLQKAEEKEIELIVSIAPNVPSVLLIDEVRLRQVLLNLIGNAIKFTEKGYVSCKIIAHYSSEDTINLEIAVKDTGIGISEEAKMLIFDSFHQQEGQSTRKYGGTGLGLSISKRLVEMMGGVIQLESEPGSGSTFTVLLNSVEVIEQRQIESKEKSNILATIEFKPSHILVVDDIAPNRELIRETFASTQVQVSEAGNGLEALEILEKHLPDLVLMDLRMPIMDGIEATTKIRLNKRLHDIPVIAFTASASHDTLTSREVELFNKVLFKPIELSNLIENILPYLPHSRVETTVNTKHAGAERFESDNLLEVAQQIPEFLAFIEGNVNPAYLKAVERGLIDDFRAFAEILLAAAKKYRVHCAAEYADSIIQAVDAFDIEQVSGLSKQYYELVGFIQGKYREYTDNKHIKT